MFRKLKRLMKKTKLDPVEVINSVLSGIYTSEEEKTQSRAVMDKLNEHRTEIQAALIAFQAQNKTLLSSGWRPFIGWVCGFALANAFVVNPILQWLFGIEGPELSLDIIIEVVITLLGLGALRTVEKMGGKTS